MNIKPQLTIIRGIPGSGKSTLAKSIAFATSGAIHLEADMWFCRNGTYEFDRNKLHIAHQWCEQETYVGLQSGQCVIVSNTFTTAKEMKPYFQMAKEFDVRPQVITVQGDFGSIHGVPDSTLEAMKKRFIYDLGDLFNYLDETSEI